MLVPNNSPTVPHDSALTNLARNSGVLSSLPGCVHSSC